MARAPKPLFLGRSSYRRRRLADAARAMPVFCALLLVLPLLWSAPGDGSGILVADLGYMLALWLGMIVATALLARGLVLGEAEESAKPPKGQGSGPDRPADAGQSDTPSGQGKS